MENAEASNQLLKNKYSLHKSPEVINSAQRTRAKTGEAVSQRPLDQIQNYLHRFHEITDRKDPEKREHGIDAVKRLLHSKFIITPAEIPETYFENQRRLARELGHGDIEITPDMKDQLTDVIIADQKSSLDKWVDYLSSPDAPYPDALKYWTIRSVTGMGEYDKEKHEFRQRSEGTTKPFPDLNREALAYALDAVQRKYEGQAQSSDAFELAEKGKFEKLLQGENFAKLYAFAIEKVTPASVDQLVDTRGEWKKYGKDSDPISLVSSLQGHGTGWCTAAESTAQTQLSGGDFYVYYSLDETGKPIIPRAAIRMQGDSIAEVRGIAAEQNLDPYINDVVSKKLEEFPDGKAYQKKVSDMKHLTAIEYKTIAGQDLFSADLTFLYEINSPIEGFGYEKDPRIEELRSQRNPEEDMLIIFDCDPSQIARSTEQITENTRAFVGSLTPGIFDSFKKHRIEHVYTTFPEGKIRFDTVTIGGKSEKVLIKELKDSMINVSEYTENMIKNPDFIRKLSPARKDFDTVRLHVKDLGIPKDYPTTTEIYKRAEELGLTLCPAEVGPHYRLQYMNQPMGEWFYIGMKPIAGPHGYPNVFTLAHYDGRLWLLSRWARPVNEWHPGNEFIFSLSK